MMGLRRRSAPRNDGTGRTSDAGPRLCKQAYNITYKRPYFVSNNTWQIYKSVPSPWRHKLEACATMHPRFIRVYPWLIKNQCIADWKTALIVE